VKGYCGKICRVDLTRRSMRVEPLAERRIERFLGARGIAARYFSEEIGPEVDALAPQNKVIFFTGPLTGTLDAATRVQLATKSAETGIYLCSNSGGGLGPQLKRAGVDGLIIEGKADELSWVSIDDGRIGFHDARPWKGFSSDRTLQELRAAAGGASEGAVAIGPAGERLVRFACVNADGRAFGRGGAGAVMGSKNLKGIVVRGTGAVAAADPVRAAEAARAAVEDLRSSAASFTKFGTSQFVEPMNYLGSMPTRNFQAATFEAADSIDSHAMLASYFRKNSACHGCSVACGKLCVVGMGRYAGARARPEYETIGMFGPNCGVSDFGAIVKASQLCDEAGMDTISSANAVALVMELSERGLVAPSDLGGIAARFGDPDALHGILQLIAERRGIGDLLAEGMSAVKRARPEWSRYILEVKGMPFAAYDPRGFIGAALTSGTSNRGACHNVGGWTIGTELQDPSRDRRSPDGKAALAKRAQDHRAYVDSLGLCAVVKDAFGFGRPPRGDLLEAVTGFAFTPKLEEIGERIYCLERRILNQEGIRRRHDHLPERITKEMLPDGFSRGARVDPVIYDEMLTEYYALRGWDADGVVTKETALRLGLDEPDS
jgi:aldehyde:ferredoxin oxidoreductase